MLLSPVERSKMSTTSHVTTLTLDLQRVKENLSCVRNHLARSGGKEPGVIAVIKGYGYGTDAPAMARLLASESVEYVAVAYVEEGVQLRDSGFHGKILVLNPDPSTFNMMGEHLLEPSLISLAQLEEYLVWATKNKSQIKPIHLNFDTGMHRLGFQPGQINVIAERLRSIPELRLATVYTHLAATESEIHDEKTEEQLSKFTSLVTTLRAELSGSPSLEGFKTHSLNSSGAIRFPQHGMDYVRVGLSLLGTELSEGEIGLMPAASFKTIITQVQTIPAGEGVGYGFDTPTDSTRDIAWLPVGYADGYPRSLSNGKGVVSIGGHLAPVVGRVCMDLTAVDVTGLSVSVGDEVELFGDSVRIEDVARAADTIPYELIARVHQRVIRRIKNAS